jgi:hypothetical protein
MVYKFNVLIGRQSIQGDDRLCSLVKKEKELFLIRLAVAAGSPIDCNLVCLKLVTKVSHSVNLREGVVAFVVVRRNRRSVFHAYADYN